MKKSWMVRLDRILRWPALAIGAATTGASGSDASAATVDGGLRTGDLRHDGVVLPNTLNSTAQDQYAAHRSHSSHGSHRSHRSSSGSRAAPTPSIPTPRPTPTWRTPSPPATTPATPKKETPAPTNTAKPTPQDLSMMVVRVQAALMRLGIFEGDIDGVLGPQTRAAIREFQKSKGIKQTGRMDVDTLTNLGISIP